MTHLPGRGGPFLGDPAAPAPSTRGLEAARGRSPRSPRHRASGRRSAVMPMPISRCGRRRAGRRGCVGGRCGVPSRHGTTTPCRLVCRVRCRLDHQRHSCPWVRRLRHGPRPVAGHVCIPVIVEGRWRSSTAIAALARLTRPGSGPGLAIQRHAASLSGPTGRGVADQCSLGHGADGESPDGRRVETYSARSRVSW